MHWHWSDGTMYLIFFFELMIVEFSELVLVSTNHRAPFRWRRHTGNVPRDFKPWHGRPSSPPLRCFILSLSRVFTEFGNGSQKWQTLLSFVHCFPVSTTLNYSTASFFKQKSYCRAVVRFHHPTHWFKGHKFWKWSVVWHESWEKMKKEFQNDKTNKNQGITVRRLLSWDCSVSFPYCFQSEINNGGYPKLVHPIPHHETRMFPNRCLFCFVFDVNYASSRTGRTSSSACGRRSVASICGYRFLSISNNWDARACLGVGRWPRDEWRPPKCDTRAATAWWITWKIRPTVSILKLDCDQFGSPLSVKWGTRCNDFWRGFRRALSRVVFRNEAGGSFPDNSSFKGDTRT